MMPTNLLVGRKSRFMILMMKMLFIGLVDLHREWVNPNNE